MLRLIFSFIANIQPILISELLVVCAFQIFTPLPKTNYTPVLPDASFSDTLGSIRATDVLISLPVVSLFLVTLHLMNQFFRIFLPRRPHPQPQILLSQTIPGQSSPGSGCADHLVSHHLRVPSISDPPRLPCHHCPLNPPRLPHLSPTSLCHPPLLSRHVTPFSRSMQFRYSHPKMPTECKPEPKKVI
jgi:hypothetical protein